MLTCSPVAEPKHRIHGVGHEAVRATANPGGWSSLAFNRQLDIVASQPERREIHVICDNVSSHKTRRGEDFLAAHRNVRMHFTPTYSSWLNQVENWFSRIQRDVISRGTSLR